MLIYVVQKLSNLPQDTECYRIYTRFKITTLVSSWWRHDRTDFHITGSVVKGITGQKSSDVDSPHKSIVTWSFDLFFGVELNKLFSKRLIWRWFDTLTPMWCCRNVINFFQLPLLLLLFVVALNNCTDILSYHNFQYTKFCWCQSTRYYLFDWIITHGKELFNHGVYRSAN